MTDMSREDLLAHLREIAAHEQRTVDDMLEQLLDTYPDVEDDDAEWDARFAESALGDALRPDGSIDFDLLDQMTTPTTLEEFYPASDAAKTHVLGVRSIS